MGDGSSWSREVTVHPLGGGILPWRFLDLFPSLSMALAVLCQVLHVWWNDHPHRIQSADVKKSSWHKIKSKIVSV